MLKKIFIALLVIYGCISLLVAGVALNDGLSLQYFLVFIVVYISAPFLAAFAIYFQHKWGLWLALILYFSVTVKYVGPESWLPLISPISLSFPISDFSNGTGYLFDFFPLCMALTALVLLLNTKGIKQEQTTKD